ncbi:Leucine-zipper-like transcriptional regulator 1 [Puccinia graminis f. sp. tritici]|uniref:Leucine-zipper-like transcriptional regulator 1 n=1 Tax=Puccinia graminis f. sp. tritici TaxID=56615 RepID=A0A5B0Q0I3_PUCGR|nr:Leucine-zipper-like transcriptional regulator 1 [Puccinia graminis f. sp. tritici]KAA1126314.1 Leucine-zipper-like transcriptional regulator 1 [Puccinia graminis f. sp. tritici]
MNSQLPRGRFAAASFNQQLLSSFLSTGSAFVTPNTGVTWNTPTGAELKKKRVRPDEDIKRWNRLRHKANSPFVASQDPENPIQSPSSQQPGPLKKKPFYYFVPPARQHDPEPNVMHTSQETLASSYKGLDHGTVIIAPRGKEAFCKAKFIPFSSMPSDELLGWEKLVCFFLSRTHYIAPVKNNGPHMGGTMWADGWRKCSKACEAFGRYCSVTRLVAMMQKSNYVAEDEAVAVREANDWISVHLQELAPGVFEDYRATLIKNNLPSMAHMEWPPSSYHALDFASFLTFTMYDFFNETHFDSDANNWTLVCWIPILNPRTSYKDDPILADDGFDMIGGQFTFRDFQVYLDLNKVVGVTMCVFRSKDHHHQTLAGSSPSDKYTRIGFSCQMSEAMSNAVVAYINGTATGDCIAGQKKQIDNAEKSIVNQDQKKAEKQREKEKSK